MGLSKEELQRDKNKIIVTIKEAMKRYQVTCRQELVHKLSKGVAQDIKEKKSSKESMALRIVTLALRCSKTPLATITGWGAMILTKK